MPRAIKKSNYHPFYLSKMSAPFIFKLVIALATIVSAAALALPKSTETLPQQSSTAHHSTIPVTANFRNRARMPNSSPPEINTHAKIWHEQKNMDELDEISELQVCILETLQLIDEPSFERTTDPTLCDHIATKQTNIAAERARIAEERTSIAEERTIIALKRASIAVEQTNFLIVWSTVIITLQFMTSLLKNESP